MGYLSECPLQGRHYMEAYIERVPVASERKACKVLRLCEKYQLREQGESVVGLSVVTLIMQKKFFGVKPNKCCFVLVYSVLSHSSECVQSTSNEGM